MHGKCYQSCMKTKYNFNLIDKLLEYKEGFVVFYPGPRPTGSSRWYFVYNPDSHVSISVSQCDELIEKGILVPKLSDKEFEVQFATGAVINRVYYMPDEIRKKVEIRSTGNV